MWPFNKKNSELVDSELNVRPDIASLLEKDWEFVSDFEENFKDYTNAHMTTIPTKGGYYAYSSGYIDHEPILKICANGISSYYNLYRDEIKLFNKKYSEVCENPSLWRSIRVMKELDAKL